jgi:hypothetical protein
MVAADLTPRRRRAAAGQVAATEGTMRILTHGVAALLAFLIGLGGGYVFWGEPGAAVGRQLQQQRAEYEYRLAEQAQRLKAAEERARLETETRKVLEEELHRLFPRS